jgi:hypothetical protein
VSTPEFLGSLTNTIAVVLEIKSNKSVTLKDVTARALRRYLLAAQSDYLVDVVSGLEPQALITKLDKSVTSGNFSSALSKATGLSVGVITMSITNVSPTTSPTASPVQQAVTDLGSAREIKGIAVILPQQLLACM